MALGYFNVVAENVVEADFQGINARPPADVYKRQGLSMFGVFEIGVKATTMGNDLQHQKGYAGSFWSGALATVISTPCLSLIHI